MGLRYRKSFKIAPGVRLNAGRKSSSISFGGRGMRYTINSKGRRTTSVGITGTGISYVTSSSSSSKGYHRTTAYSQRQQLQQRQKEIAKLEELKRNQNECELFQNQIELLTSIHKECDDPVDWQDIKNTPHPFGTDSIGPLEKEATKRYVNYKPSFTEWIFKREEKSKEKLKKAILEAHDKDLKNLEECKALVALATNVLEGDIDTYFNVIQEMDPLVDLTDFGSGFEFSTDDPSYIEVEFDAHSEKMIPPKEQSLTQPGRISVKEWTKTKYYDLQQDYICSCAIRIARDMFSLLPVKEVYVHAYEDFFSSQTGNTTRTCILSVRFNREIIESLNMERIDCSDSMVNFQHNMDFKKTKGFLSVQKLVPVSTHQ
jgi:predicted transcriptional regulator